MRNSKNRRRGFTLVELMVVVAILAILATYVAVNFGGVAESAKQKAAVNQIATFGGAMELYKITHSKYPGSLEQLTKTDPKFGNKYYIKSIPTDPWGNKYKYEKTSGGFKITCRGADGANGGTGVDADITTDNLDKFK